MRVGVDNGQVKTFFPDNADARPASLLMQGMPHYACGAMDRAKISGITVDSREVKPGDLFVAIQGEKVDGHQFVEEAIAKGCAAFIVQQGRLPAKNGFPAVAIEVPDTRTALAGVAGAFYDHPEKELRFIGITGTNGKTTTSFLVEAMLNKAGYIPGVIGTVNYRYQGMEFAATHTTPDPIVLYRTLRRMKDAGVTHVVMEVSSHALAQKRIHGLSFDVAVFTNITRDHLDFHGDMESYFQSKKKLFFEYLKKDGRAVIMLEMETPHNGQERTVLVGKGQALAAELVAPIRCGMERNCDLYPEDFVCSLAGIKTTIQTPQGRLKLHSSLVGQFNLMNLLTAAGVGIALELSPETIADGIQSLKNVPGRLERINSRKGLKVFVDYAHTPDALANVLTTLKQFNPPRLICIFGCGGDRDRGKRAMMGKVAGSLCDIALVTSDNPRSERPEAIMQEIEQGLAHSLLKRIRAELLFENRNWQGYDLIVSRREAIALAIIRAHQDDVVLIAGKGHENYQIIGNHKRFFDDRLEAVGAEFMI